MRPHGLRHRHGLVRHLRLFGQGRRLAAARPLYRHPRSRNRRKKALHDLRLRRRLHQRHARRRIVPPVLRIHGARTRVHRRFDRLPARPERAARRRQTLARNVPATASSNGTHGRRGSIRRDEFRRREVCGVGDRSRADRRLRIERRSDHCPARSLFHRQ